ncbi:unnamed protein product [Peronospora belbahrii]|uniref:OTU domain-containing protein n=1 Tax=Peronospora belbahrii TaxID=622444 RepID=A0ABN8CUG1_9STRA|nr:unnamed protein product [Peronospora belbahrii]
MQASRVGPSAAVSPGPMLTQVSQTFAAAMDSLGLREVATPASGNCFAMAIVQGATNKDLAEPTSKLKQLTATLKTGVKEDYASNPSEREAVVADNTWGGNDVIGLAAMFLRRSIYVLELEDTRANPWSCRQFEPAVLYIRAKSIASFTERPLDILECLNAIRADIIDSSAPPIVLRY